jgi:SAM-dependent methyltransferase
VPEATVEKAAYGNWVSTKFVFVPGALGLVFGGLAFLLPGLGVVAAILMLCSLYFAYARYRFSPGGGDIQTRVQDLVLDRMADWDGRGKVLDIGCGNGPLTIQIAKRFPQAEVLGIDYWGKAWAYSKGVCDRNAEIEGVAERVSFERASASSLPFEEGAFDMVVSNLVFHEVRDVKDKRALIKEALRVVRKDGWFVFQDLFVWRQVYGAADDLLDTIRSWGIETVECVDTSDSAFIPTALKLPFMLGTVGILYGRK